MTAPTAPVRPLLLRVADRGIGGSFAVVAVLLAVLVVAAPATLALLAFAVLALATVIGIPAAATVLLFAGAAALAVPLWRWSR